MVQLTSVAVLDVLFNRPPPPPAELPLTVQTVSEIVPLLSKPPPNPLSLTLLPLTVQVEMRDRAAIVDAATTVGGVATESACGERSRAEVVQAATIIGCVAAEGATGQPRAYLICCRCRRQSRRWARNCR